MDVSHAIPATGLGIPAGNPVCKTMLLDDGRNVTISRLRHRPDLPVVVAFTSRKGKLAGTMVLSLGEALEFGRVLKLAASC